MKEMFRFLYAVAACLFLLSLNVVSAHSQVVINELLADPARDWDGDGEVNSRNDEWVEIVNFGEAPVDLAGYLLADGDGETVWRYGFSGLLGQGDVFIVYGSESRAWEEANDFPVYGLSLNNTGDWMRLYRVSGSETLLVDSIQFGDEAAEDDRSVGRPDGSAADWELYDAYNPCGDSCNPPGNGCIPTPGAPNECTTGAGRDCWSTVKSRYR